MLVTKYLNQIPFQLGKKLGDGADGEVFEIKNNKVIKFSIVLDIDSRAKNYTIQNIVNNNFKIFKFIKENPINSFSRIYDFDILKTDFINGFEGKINYIIYFYTLEKLNELSINDKDILKNIFHEANEKNKNSFIDLSEQELMDKLKNNNLYSRILNLYFDLKKYKINHLDIDVRNIMKKNNDFKLIDFDRCELKGEI